MSNTRTESSKELVGQSSIQFIRPTNLTLTLIEARPNTRMNVFINEENINHLCQPIPIRDEDIFEKKGDPIITDGMGQAKFFVFLPGGTYNTGLHEFTVTDAESFEQLNIGGSVFGSAKGAFSATGTVSIYQEVQVSITTVERIQNVAEDPLAQSFFTHGLDEGIFVSSIDVFFYSKDDSIPVRCELRKMKNGYPSLLTPVKSEFVSVVSAENIRTSENASVSTKFTFDPPVFLEPESDFCFVLRSNSNNYNVFTATMGETSIEDGRGIFEQPYMGSLFKSENNITWTAFQFEDMKFRINKASFDTSVPATLHFDAKVPPVGALGTNFHTTSGSNLIKYVHSHDHGLEENDTFKVIVQSHLRDNGVANGIPLAQFEGVHRVLQVLDRKTVVFAVTNNASSSGPVESCGCVSHVHISSEGKGYRDSDTIVFTRSHKGSQATASLKVDSEGRIKEVNVSNPGSGYASGSPVATVNTSTGSGAVIHAMDLPSFTVWVNKPYTRAVPNISINNYGSATSFSAELDTVIGNYENGPLQTYSRGKKVSVNPNQYIDLEQNSLVVSDLNNLSGTRNTSMTVELYSTSPDVSPVISLKTPPSLDAYYNRINTQNKKHGRSSEDRHETSISSGSVTSIKVSSKGAGYDSAPNVIIDPPDDIENGIQATARASINSAGEVIDSIEIIEPGKGYKKDPLVSLTGGGSSDSVVQATARAFISKFNSELLPKNGNAKAKYITKIFPLQLPSVGLRIFCTLSSVNGSYVDWYARTSLSTTGVDHESLEWKKMIPTTDTNKSTSKDEFLEYEFIIDDLEEFDTYDLKCVLGAENPIKAPIVKSYRVIAVV